MPSFISNVNLLANNVDDINAISENLPDIQLAVDLPISQVANMESAINTVNANSANINKVAAVDSAVSTLASIDNEIVTLSNIPVNVLIDASNAVGKAEEAALSAISAAGSATEAKTYLDDIKSDSIVVNAMANIGWGGFDVVDGDLVVGYYDPTVSVPTIVDGDFILEIF